MIDHEFEKQIHAHTAEWTMVPKILIKGLTAVCRGPTLKKVVDSDVDIIKAALPNAENLEKNIVTWLALVAYIQINQKKYGILII